MAEDQSPAPEISAVEIDRLQADRYLILIENLFEFAHNAIKAVVLANGAAATALLTFLSNRHGSPPSTLFAFSLVAFAAGVAFGVFTSCLAYLSQYDAAKRAQERNFKVELLAHRKRTIAVWMLFVGIGWFLVGTILSAFAFTRIS